MSDDIINRYINKTILDYYNISLPKIIVDVWTKPYNGTRLMTSYDSNINIKLNNISGGLYYENNEYIYKIKVNMTDNKSYFSKFTFTKK